MMHTITVDVDVYVDDIVDQIRDGDLIRELERRGHTVVKEHDNTITDQEKDLICKYLLDIGIDNENRELYEKLKKPQRILDE